MRGILLALTEAQCRALAAAVAWHQEVHAGMEPDLSFSMADAGEGRLALEAALRVPSLWATIEPLPMPEVERWLRYQAQLRADRTETARRLVYERHFGQEPVEAVIARLRAGDERTDAKVKEMQAELSAPDAELEAPDFIRRHREAQAPKTECPLCGNVLFVDRGRADYCGACGRYVGGGS